MAARIVQHPYPRRAVRNPRILEGEPTLEGTRVSVRTVVVASRYLASVRQIVDAYPMLDQTAVEMALAFYDAHQAEIDCYIAENEDSAS
ncbi:MAG: DUF433 domain-containing protein [Chloroflexi bacterium]|nr:DUF433 domain-containing protein [Chloroflexota bacterium]